MLELSSSQNKSIAKLTKMHSNKSVWAYTGRRYRSLRLNKFIKAKSSHFSMKLVKRPSSSKNKSIVKLIKMHPNKSVCAYTGRRYQSIRLNKFIKAKSSHFSVKLVKELSSSKNKSIVKLTKMHPNKSVWAYTDRRYRSLRLNKFIEATSSNFSVK